jgi:hypothetical protein
MVKRNVGSISEREFARAMFPYDVAEPLSEQYEDFKLMTQELYGNLDKLGWDMDDPRQFDDYEKTWSLCREVIYWNVAFRMKGFPWDLVWRTKAFKKRFNQSKWYFDEEYFDKDDAEFTYYLAQESLGHLFDRYRLPKSVRDLFVFCVVVECLIVIQNKDGMFYDWCRDGELLTRYKKKSW